MTDWTRRGRGRALWSKREIIDAIGAHFSIHAKAPRIGDWQRASPAHPTAATVTRKFGTWNSALEAAGVPVNKYRRRWTREQVIAALQHDAASRGSSPCSSDWLHKSDVNPSSKTVRRLFGSFNRGVEAAALGLPPKHFHHKDEWTESEIINAIADEATVSGRTPKVSDWSAKGGTRPSYKAIVTTFGTWRTALLAAGLDESSMPSAGPGQGWTRPKILAALVTQATLTDSSPAKKKWRRGSSGKHPNEATVRAVFGTWSAALVAAGIGKDDPVVATSRRYSLAESHDQSRSPFDPA